MFFLTASLVVLDASASDCVDLSGQYQFEAPCLRSDYPGEMFVPTGRGDFVLPLGGTLTIVQAGCVGLAVRASDGERSLSWSHANAVDRTAVRIDTQKAVIKRSESSLYKMTKMSVELRKTDQNLLLEAYSYRRTVIEPFGNSIKNTCVLVPASAD